MANRRDANAAKTALVLKAPPAALPPAPAPAISENVEAALPEAFQKGGQFSHIGHPRCKGYEDKIFNRKAVYIDNDGREYPAYLVPLPVNKGSIFDGPGVEDANGEMNKIAKLPFEKQVEALADLNARMQSKAKFFLINGTRNRLVELDGTLLKTVRIQDERGGSVDIPVAELVVNFSREPGLELWRLTSNVMHQDYIPRARKGASGPTCFRLA